MKMRTIVLVLSLIALAAPAQAEQKTHARHENQSLEQKCRAMVGKETVEGEGAKSYGPDAGAALQRLHDGHAELILPIGVSWRAGAGGAV
jgi:hypothetical protein